MSFEQVFAVDELWDGEMVSCIAGGRKIVLLRIGDTIRAYEDRCVHLGVALSEGQFDGRVITCSAHHYQYNALTGCGINPRGVCLTRFPVRIESGAIWIDAAAGFRDGEQDGPQDG